MKQVLILGAGLSATYLIEYFEANADANNWHLTIADREVDAVRKKISREQTEAISLDSTNSEQLKATIYGKSLVISLLPAQFHYKVAQLCVELGVHFASASYLSKEIKELNKKAKKQNLILLNECGLDPGIDHLSAMKLLDGIRSKGGSIDGFESFTGGLVAQDCEDNPWRYKFTWNPRNVILAGSGGAVRFIHNNQYKYIPYSRVFRRTETVNIEGYGRFEGYANRDSLKYREVYGLSDVKTMYRGTFRRPGFSKAWNCFVQLGATDDSYVLENSENLSNRQFINTFLAYHPTDSIELKLRQYLRIDQDDVDLWEKLESTGIFSEETVGIPNATPAQMLQKIFEKCWSLGAEDRDMIVMWHKVNYELDGKAKRLESSLVCEGKNRKHTAMAKTVGLPLAMACKLILQDKIKATGALIPITPEFYYPILEELEDYGISFKEVGFT